MAAGDFEYVKEATAVRCMRKGCGMIALYQCRTCPAGGALCQRCAAHHGPVCLWTSLAPGDAPAKPSLYTELGGIYALAMVVDHFSDELLKDAQVGKHSALNEYLKRWGETESKTRLAGLKFQRTLWLSAQAGGPYQYLPSEAARLGACPMSLEAAHFKLHIEDGEFDRVAAILAKSLDHFGIGGRQKDTVLKVFAGHKREVTLGHNYSASDRLEDISMVVRENACAK